jgi:hypothetical protein
VAFLSGDPLRDLRPTLCGGRLAMRGSELLPQAKGFAHSKCRVLFCALVRELIPISSACFCCGDVGNALCFLALVLVAPSLCYFRVRGAW